MWVCHTRLIKLKSNNCDWCPFNHVVILTHICTRRSLQLLTYKQVYAKNNKQKSFILIGRSWLESCETGCEMTTHFLLWRQMHVTYSNIFGMEFPVSTELKKCRILVLCYDSRRAIRRPIPVMCIGLCSIASWS